MAGALEISVEPLAAGLSLHAALSIAFLCDRVLDVREDPNGAVTLTERALEEPFRKDYDAQPGGAPGEWSTRFDVSHWGLLVARRGGVRVGGAILAHRTPESVLLGDREDRALLWDLRVAPDARRQGVGRTLVSAAAKWAVARSCTALLIETQNINVAACRLYAASGARLRSVVREAYPTRPEEIQLIWGLDLPVESEDSGGECRPA